MEEETLQVVYSLIFGGCAKRFMGDIGTQWCRPMNIYVGDLHITKGLDFFPTILFFRHQSIMEIVPEVSK